MLLASIRSHVPAAPVVAVVVCAGFCYFLNDGISFAFGIIYSELRNVFENDAASTAVLPAMVDAVPQFSGILTCPFVQAVGSGASAAIGSIIVSLGFFVSTFVSSLLPLYFTIGILSAVGLELVYVAALGAVANATTTNRGLAVGLTVCCSGLGTVFFSYVLPLLLNEYFWAGTFMIVSSFFLNTLVVAIIFYYQFDLRKEVESLTENQDERILVRAEEEEEEEEEDGDRNGRPCCSWIRKIWFRFVKEFMKSISLVFTLHLWANVNFLVFMFNEFIHGMTMVVPESLLYDQLVSSGFGQWEAATVQAVFSGLSTVGHLFWGVIGDRLPPIHVYCFAQLFTAISVMFIPSVGNFDALVCLVAVAGFFRGYNETLYSLVLIQELGISYFYAGLVVLLAVVGAGNMIGTPLGGFIFDRRKSYTFAFQVSGCILIGSTVILFSVTRIVDFVRKRQAQRRVHTPPSCT